MIDYNHFSWREVIPVGLMAAFLLFIFGYLVGSIGSLPCRQFGKEPKKNFNFVTNSPSIQVPQTLSEKPKVDKNFTISQ